jgi:hypothetical protein
MPFAPPSPHFGATMLNIDGAKHEGLWVAFVGLLFGILRGTLYVFKHNKPSKVRFRIGCGSFAVTVGAPFLTTWLQTKIKESGDTIEGTRITHKALEDTFPFGYVVISKRGKKWTYELSQSDFLKYDFRWDQKYKTGFFERNSGMVYRRFCDENADWAGI